MLRSRTFILFILFGVVFTLFSIPFFTGMMRPTFSEKNPYALLYASFNLPVKMVFSGMITSLAESAWETPTPAQRDRMEFFVSLAFWSVLGGVIGLVKDLRGERG